ncbi:MAG: dihydropteroate synthase [Microbacteriaceae bacterium]|jgi:dihydropteroate synthase|nr:dihydropteroate synthase [Microbacteriaceae bacterium]MCI1207380.1 dihydropteroate synthase [Microbacteriaceae bacterium]
MLVMGIVNVTPDSFSDGGRWATPDAAIAHGRALLREGADVLDVGGESTRPGATPVSVEEEQRRVLPVLQGLSGEHIPMSVDTMHAETARAAVAAGARYINDVSGGLLDAGMADAVAETGACVILSHWRGRLGGKGTGRTEYADVTNEVAQHLAARADAFLRAGVSGDRIVLDPGLGFSKTSAQSWQLLHEVATLQGLGYPLLIGASRKRFLSEAIPEDVSDQQAARDAATAAISVAMARRGVWGVRVHDVAGTVAAVRATEQVEGVAGDGH